MLGGVDTGSSARLLPDISQCAEQQPFAGKGELLRRRRFWREGDADGWSGLDEHVKTAQLQVLTSMMATGGRGGGGERVVDRSGLWGESLAVISEATASLN